MKLRVLAQRADLIRDHALEVRVEQITKAFEAWQQRQTVRRIAMTRAPRTLHSSVRSHHTKRAFTSRVVCKRGHVGVYRWPEMHCLPEASQASLG